jgi:hypothetical protein
MQLIEVAIASLLPTSTTSRLRYSLIAGGNPRTERLRVEIQQGGT